MPIEFHPMPSSDDFVSSALHDHCIIRITTDSCSLHEDFPQIDRFVDPQMAPRWSARCDSEYQPENSGDDLLVGVQQVEGAGLAFPLGSERQTNSVRALSFPGQDCLRSALASTDDPAPSILMRFHVEGF